MVVVTQDNLGQKSITQIADSSQTSVDPESPMPGPSGLSTCGRSDEFAPCPEISNQEKPIFTSYQRGPKRKVYSPMTATVISRLKNDRQRYRKSVRIKRHRKISTRAMLDKLKLPLIPELYKLLGSQVALHCRKRKERRWSREVKEFALNMYFHGPSSYR